MRFLIMPVVSAPTQLQTQSKGVPHSGQGFTLVELLVALMIMSVVSVLAYSAFGGILEMERRSKTEFLQQNRLQLAVSTMINDLLHLRARSVRDRLGGYKRAYAVPSDEYPVEFTRGGLPDFDYMRGGIQRIAYRVENGQLIRTTWRVADRSNTTESYHQVLADGIAGLQVSQLNEKNEFVPHWPPLDQRLALNAVPAMIRVELRLEQGQPYTFLIPGPDHWHAEHAGEQS